MDMKGIFMIAKEVIMDWRVIFITVALIIYISLANYVVKYRKKPPKVKGKPKPVAPAPEPQAAEGQTSSDGKSAPAAEAAS
jgi:hypothetical protein